MAWKGCSLIVCFSHRVFAAHIEAKHADNNPTISGYQHHTPLLASHAKTRRRNLVLKEEAPIQYMPCLRPPLRVLRVLRTLSGVRGHRLAHVQAVGVLRHLHEYSGRGRRGGNGKCEDCKVLIFVDTTFDAFRGYLFLLLYVLGWTVSPPDSSLDPTS